MRTSALLTERLGDALRVEWGLSLNEYQVLALLAECSQHATSRTSDLAREVHLSVSGLSRLIDRLVARGLIARCRGAGPDGRSFRLALTDTGAALYLAAADGHRARVRRMFFDRMTPGEVRALANLLETTRQERRC